ncbi:ATP-dependent DNA helicase PIF1 [Linum perenne]
MSNHFSDPGYFSRRAILALFHEIVSQINSYLLAQFPGDEICYYSSDSIENDVIQPTTIVGEFSTEFLNSLENGNFPAHELKLKVGVPVILLRNIDQLAGLCNGTRLIIKTLGIWFIEVEILTDTHTGERVYLPRRQYSIALSFAMTINKSQGQTLDHVGIYLKRQVFTHGLCHEYLEKMV